jgi:catechol 2,3-dioxygenase
MDRRGRDVSGPQGPVTPTAPAARPIDPHVRVGHVHLRTSDIARIRAFYVDVMGFDVVFEARDVPGWGTTGDVLFVSAGGYHHHIGFNTWKSKGGPPQPDGVAGLHHVALLFSSRARLADAVQRIVDAGVPLRQLSDHGTHPRRLPLRPRRQRPRARVGPPVRGVAGVGRARDRREPRPR